MPYLIREIGARRAAQEPVILLVPEQYTLQAERELTEGLSLPGLLDLGGRPGLRGLIAAVVDDLEEAGLTPELLREHADKAEKTATRLKT